MMSITTAPAAEKPERKGRLSAEDWAQAALDLIAEHGVAAVAVEPLARRLGVTKGSFYWHFPSDRKSVVQGKSVSVSVDLGGRRILKKNKHKPVTLKVESQLA